jgi:hypothetical protein
MDALGPGLGEETVKVLAGLAEELIGAVTQPQHGKLEPFQLADLALLELLEQIDGALRGSPPRKCSLPPAGGSLS